VAAEGAFFEVLGGGLGVGGQGLHSIGRRRETPLDSPKHYAPSVRNGTEPLNVSYRVAIEERKFWESDLVPAIPIRSRERNVQDQSARRIRILARYDDDRASLGSRPKVR
jgi:hypothetical protein